jgi:16S rRNA (guanine527-N7)-methyltransferase
MIQGDEKERLGLTLLNGANQLDIPLSKTQLQLLLSYLEELIRWNRTYNLTAVRNPRDMIFRHILDSLTVLPYLHGGHMLDLGSGAGLPGVILAVMAPEREFILLEANGKKASFLRHIKAHLNLINIIVVQARAEDYQPPGLRTSILCRAFATLPVITRLCRHLLIDEGRILAMKGIYPDEELAQLPSDYHLRKVHRLQVPGLAEDRHLVELEKI